MEEVIGSTPIFSTKADQFGWLFFSMSYFIYILYSEKCDRYYVGQTEYLERRVAEHNNSKGGAYSSSCLPWKLVYHESVLSRSDALKREKEIKGKKSRKYIEYLISKG
jgi:putative endonuclease